MYRDHNKGDEEEVNGIHLVLSGGANRAPDARREGVKGFGTD